MAKTTVSLPVSLLIPYINSNGYKPSFPSNLSPPHALIPCDKFLGQCMLTKLLETSKRLAYFNLPSTFPSVHMSLFCQAESWEMKPKGVDSSCITEKV